MDPTQKRPVTPAVRWEPPRLERVGRLADVMRGQLGSKVEGSSGMKQMSGI